MASDYDVAAGLLREPRLTLHTPIQALTPSSACPHRGPYPDYSTLVCVCCHAAGGAAQRRLKAIRAATERLEKAKAKIEKAKVAKFKPKGSGSSKRKRQAVA